jgi:hypothetical protein
MRQVRVTLPAAFAHYEGFGFGAEKNGAIMVQVHRPLRQNLF